MQTESQVSTHSMRAAFITTALELEASLEDVRRAAGRDLKRIEVLSEVWRPVAEAAKILGITDRHRAFQHINKPICIVAMDSILTARQILDGDH
jgi:hypothetical protein